ncbi:MAG: glutamate 5-kinase [Candidatus Binatia bacterium]|nr:MAG: glutamate 5-kinase [Candidatus Binatia bacterium]
MTDQLAAKQHWLRNVRRAVVKIGSSILSNQNGIDESRLSGLVHDICTLHRQGIAIVVVTSGAVAAGMARLGRRQRPKSIPERQAAAAVGQIDLMALYKKYAAEHGVQVAQILLTHDDLASRHRYLNARHTLEELFRAHVLPVANENDTVVTEELRNFGDNDNLSALIAGLVEADLLVLLSDVEGVCTSNPRRDPSARLVELIAHPRRMAGIQVEGHSPLGTGGMASKLAAARKAAHAGIPTVIASGLVPGTLLRVFDVHARVGTLVLPRADRLQRRKHWIAYTLRPAGTITVDRGAFEAVVFRGRSLLPSGIRAVEGKFEAGDCVRCVTETGEEFARGLVNYTSSELEKIRGLHSQHIERVLGYRSTDEAIHRNDLVLTGDFSQGAASAGS